MNSPFVTEISKMKFSTSQFAAHIAAAKTTCSTSCCQHGFFSTDSAKSLKIANRPREFQMCARLRRPRDHSMLVIFRAVECHNAPLRSRKTSIPLSLQSPSCIVLHAPMFLRVSASLPYPDNCWIMEPAGTGRHSSESRIRHSQSQPAQLPRSKDIGPQAVSRL